MTYTTSAITSKSGINFIRSAVEAAGCLFIKIDHENDLGIDALIEFIENGKPLNKQIAVQIKSGNSYFNANTKECIFPVGTHREYWASHPLPVFGLVFVPALAAVHWIDLKSYIRTHPEQTVVKYGASKANQLDQVNFKKFFIPAVTRSAPLLTSEEALELANSDRLDESVLGLIVLLRRHANQRATWDALTKFISQHPAAEIPNVLIYFLAQIPGHPDIYYSRESPDPEIRAYGKALLSAFRYPEIIKLLALVDRENGFNRGSVGQSVEAVISSIPDSSSHLRRAIIAPDVPMFIKECAALILAMNEGASALPDLARLASLGSAFALEVADSLRGDGNVNPYG